MESNKKHNKMKMEAKFIKLDSPY